VDINDVRIVSGSRNPPRPALPQDPQLVVDAQLGDVAALAALYEAHAPRVRRFCYGLVRHEEEAADLASEAFLTAMERLGTLKDPRAFPAWLLMIARNKVLDHLRVSRRTVLLADGIPQAADVPAPPPGPPGDPDGAGALVARATAALTPRYGLVLELAFVRNLDASDVAGALGIELAHAYVLISRVREAFREALCAAELSQAPVGQCRELDAVAPRFRSDPSPASRRAVLRHARSCGICGPRRTSVQIGLSNLS